MLSTLKPESAYSAFNLNLVSLSLPRYSKEWVTKLTLTMSGDGAELETPDEATCSFEYKTEDINAATWQGLPPTNRDPPPCTRRAPPPRERELALEKNILN